MEIFGDFVESQGRKKSNRQIEGLEKRIFKNFGKAQYHNLANLCILHVKRNSQIEGLEKDFFFWKIRRFSGPMA